MLKVVAIVLWSVFAVLAIIGIVLHLRVTRTVRQGSFTEFRRAMRWQNYDLAQTYLSPSGLADMKRLRRVSQGLMTIMIGAAALMAAQLILGGELTAR